MDFTQILNAYIDEYYIREFIKITNIDVQTIKLELPDRIITLYCNNRGIVEQKTRKRRGIPFMDQPVGVRIPETWVASPAGLPVDEEVADELPEPATVGKRIVNIDDKADDELPGQISITDLLKVDSSNEVKRVTNDFPEGSLVSSIYCSSIVFKVKGCYGNMVNVFDEKTSTSHQIANADLVLVENKEPNET